MDKTIIADALEFVKNTFNNDYSGHDYFHTLRVYKTATKIAEHDSISNSEARDILNLAESTTKRILSDMVNKNLLTAVGERKARKYIIK